MTSEYNPFRTAIKRGGTLSKPMTILLKNNLLQGKILDFGCGWGTDHKILSAPPYNLNIQGYDKHSPEFSKNYYLVNDDYDIITCHYMFNVIPDLKTHRFTLEILRSMCKAAYITVRSDEKAIKDSWVYSPTHLGYFTSKGTFQRFYDEEMVLDLFGDVEFIANNNSMKLFKIKGSVNDEKININDNSDDNSNSNS